MAIPWAAIRRIDLATGNIVEDVKMGLDLAAAGYAPRYCPEARVESDFPATERGFVDSTPAMGNRIRCDDCEDCAGNDPARAIELECSAHDYGR